jgi:hypothetical protein
MSFELPIRNGRISPESTKNSLVVEGGYYDTVISPQDGQVTKVDEHDCGGKIEIEHNGFQGTIKSKLCHCGDISVKKGDNVAKSQKISTLTGNKVQLTFLDSRNEKISPYEILGIKSLTDDSKKEEKKKEEKGLGDVQPEKKKEKETNQKTTDDSPKRSEYDPSKEIPNPFMDLLLSPFHFIGGALSKKGKNLKEEIDRIKELIK